MTELKGGGSPPTQYTVLLEGGGPPPTQYPVLLKGGGPPPTQYSVLLREGCESKLNEGLRTRLDQAILLPSGQWTINQARR